LHTFTDRRTGLIRTGQKHVGVLGLAVGEVAGAGGDRRGTFAHLGLVAHAQREETLEIRSLNNAKTARAKKAKVADLGFKPNQVTRVE
jgi:hypothetical protein